MEKRTAVILRHKSTGLYFDRMAEHTTRLWAAWRFPDQEFLNVWLGASIYAPNLDEYDVVPVTLTIELEEEVEVFEK